MARWATASQAATNAAFLQTTPLLAANIDALDNTAINAALENLTALMSELLASRFILSTADSYLYPPLLQRA